MIGRGVSTSSQRGLKYCRGFRPKLTAVYPYNVIDSHGRIKPPLSGWSALSVACGYRERMILATSVVAQALNSINERFSRSPGKHTVQNTTVHSSLLCSVHSA